MFLGHLAVGFASKAAAPKVSLGTLMAAPILLDLLWPIFLLLGWEKVVISPGITAVTPLDFVSYPYSHSLVAASVWALLFALLVFLKWKSQIVAAVIALSVVSHWVLDWITHRPDMPLLVSGGPRVGLSLWSSVPATLAVESVMFLVGLVLYLRTTRAADRTGTISFWAFVGAIVAIYLSAVFGPPPPNTQALAVMGLGTFMIPFWAGVFDRHRVASR